MRPIIFDKSETNFTTNGLGRLDCISCKVTEERNGMYELEAEIPESGINSGKVGMETYLVVRPAPDVNFQPFRVYQITKNVSGTYTILAQHISYQLSYIPAMPFSISASSSACAQTLAALKANAAVSCPFNFSTDVTTNASYTQTTPAPIRSRLGGIEGSVLDQFHGEYEWDVYDVKLWKDRGAEVPKVTLKYGKNITDLSQEESIASTVTGVCPYWQSSDGQVVTLTEKVVESSYASRYAFKRVATVDFSQDFQTPPSEAELRAAAQAYVGQYDIGVPSVSIKVSFIDLADTEEYKDVASLERVHLCDNINVYFEPLDISTTAKVVKCEYDVLEERYISVEIGTIRSTLAHTISSTEGAITAAEQKATYEVRNATAWLTNGDGYVVATKDATTGAWKELLFMDTADVTTARKVLRINENGIGFSGTGVNGTYTQAWTLDGKLVIGGTNAPSLTVYDNSNNILFQTDKDGMEWNALYSSMTKAGVITATGGTFTNITASGGTFSNIKANGGTFSNITASGGTFSNIKANGGTFSNITASGGTFSNIKATGGKFTDISASGSLVAGDLTLANGVLSGADNGGTISTQYLVGGAVEGKGLQLDGDLCAIDARILVKDPTGRYDYWVSQESGKYVKDIEITCDTRDNGNVYNLQWNIIYGDISNGIIAETE